MPGILIRELDTQVIKRLKSRAKRNGRSLQQELRMLLERSAGVQLDEVQEIFKRWDARFAGRKFSSSVNLIREDHAR